MNEMRDRLRALVAERDERIADLEDRLADLERDRDHWKRRCATYLNDLATWERNFPSDKGGMVL